MKYRIIRNYHRLPSNPHLHLETKKRTVKRGLTIEEAQAHCRDPATSTGEKGTAKKIDGWDWWDGYDIDPS